MVIERQYADGVISKEQMREAVADYFGKRNYSGKSILVIVPDNTRSGPVGGVFKAIYDCIGNEVSRLDVLVALGTHQPISEEQICTRLTITQEERNGKYKAVKFFNHQWDNPEMFKFAGQIHADKIERLTKGLFSEEVEVMVNKLVFDYDEFFIIGPVFPHEVVGFSGGHKYIFPGVAGPQIINFFHWLGAVITNPAINGNKWTATREVVENAASYIKTPHTLFAIVSNKEEFKGIFIGDCVEAWERAADLSAKVHIVYKDKPYKTVLGIAPNMYDEMWTAGKVMYKLEPVIADGGMLIIYAPHIKEVSVTHGKTIEQVGYHTRDYFLKQWDKFKDYPLGAIAHCTHVKGIGTYNNGVEKPRINVVLATGISRERCKKINLGYMDPEQIDIANYEGKEDKGILVVHDAGETLYRLADGSIPRIRE
ncbi:MAG: lactate racemase domain-containing protein [Sedimentisphaerales bacterium]|jgi:nickel-dependent lactate racemase